MQVFHCKCMFILELITQIVSYLVAAFLVQIYFMLHEETANKFFQTVKKYQKWFGFPKRKKAIRNLPIWWRQTVCCIAKLQFLYSNFLLLFLFFESRGNFSVDGYIFFIKQCCIQFFYPNSLPINLCWKTNKQISVNPVVFR